MSRSAFALMIALLVLPGELIAREVVHEIDLEVVSLLGLSDEQALAYSTIMQRQRAVYRNLQPRHWEQQKAFYEETYARLRPVLTGEQYLRFLAYMDSFIEATPDDELLVME